jgi:phosphatidylglycerol:prolipoprotein diacylglycerol transferase
MLPKLFHIGDFFLPSYGLLVALGFLLGLWITVRLAKRAGLPADKITNLVIYCALAGLAGAKLFMFIFDWRTFWEHPSEIFSLSTLRAAGVYQGGFLLAFVVAVIYVKRAKLPFLQTCDIFSPGIAIAHTIGRLGCLAAGCCWGRETHVPWAITFRNPDAREMSGTPLDVPLHPTQIYEAIANALIFVFLYWRSRRTHATGSIFGWYLVLYSSARFAIEFYRFHEQSTWLTLSLTQWISLATLVAGLWLLIVKQWAPSGHRPVSPA